MAHLNSSGSNYWTQQDAILCSTDSKAEFNHGVAKLIDSLYSPLQLLGFGEPLHGSRAVLQIRNALFKQLVQAHGYTAIAIESSFLKSNIVNDYIQNIGPSSYEAVEDIGFSHNFGKDAANRELIEWMRTYNVDSEHTVKVRFYGFDSPTEMTSTDSPRKLLNLILNYLASFEDPGERELERRQRIETLLGDDADWENPTAMMDPAKSVGRSEEARMLRIETEELIAELQIRRPELISRSQRESYLDIVHYASMARQLLNYHAAVSQTSTDRLSRMLGLRDAMMADNLVYIVAVERHRGKVLATAHNTHLQRGQAKWVLGPHINIWWPAGSHLQEMLGSGYGVIGSGVGISEADGVGRPESDTIEAQLISFMQMPNDLLFAPTGKVKLSEMAVLRTRSESSRNSTYIALKPQALTDFDWIAMYSRSDNRE